MRHEQVWRLVSPPTPLKTSCHSCHNIQVEGEAIGVTLLAHLIKCLHHLRCHRMHAEHRRLLLG